MGTHRLVGDRAADFLEERWALAPNVVTNPPFNRAAEFWEHAVNPIPSKVALLRRLAWLEGQDRGAMFKWVPLSRVWVFSGRLPIMHRVGYDGPKSTSTTPHAWFVFDPEHIGPWTGGWL